MPSTQGQSLGLERLWHGLQERLPQRNAAELTIPFCPAFDTSEETMSGRWGIWLLTTALALAAVSAGRKQLPPLLQQDSDVAQDPCRFASVGLHQLPYCVQFSTATMTDCSHFPAAPGLFYGQHL